MSEYLTKEEIKQWRSSLEKITLEEFAARLGKQIEEAKHTNDLVDIVLKVNLTHLHLLKCHLQFVLKRLIQLLKKQ